MTPWNRFKFLKLINSKSLLFPILPKRENGSILIRVLKRIRVLLEESQ